MYTEASATQQTMFDETSYRTYRRFSTDFFSVPYYHNIIITFNDHFVFVIGVVLICYWLCSVLLIIFTNAYLKGLAMSVRQIFLACSGHPLSSNVLNACIGHVATQN